MKLNNIYMLLLVILFAATGYSQVAVIANKSVSDNSINISKLTDIYFLRVKVWSNGNAIVPLTIKSENGTVDKFFSSIGKSYEDMKKIWMKLQLTGEGMAPEALGSEDEIINKVSSTPGAIGFVSASKVNDKVKVLLTIN